MSISRFQEKFLGGGCAKFIFGFMAVVFVGSLLYLGQSRGTRDDSSSTHVNDVVANIGSSEVTAAALDQSIQQAFDRQSQQFTQPGQPPMDLPPEVMGSVASGAVTELVQEAGVLYLARQSGAKLDDEGAKSAVLQHLETQIKNSTDEFVSQGKLKANATDKEIDDQFTKQYKYSRAQIRVNQAAQIDAFLKDPTKRTSVMAQAAAIFLRDIYKKKLAISEADVIAQYTTYEVKQLLFADEMGKPSSKQADTVLADIRSGKLTFEQAMDRFSKVTPPAGKKASEVTMPLMGSTVATDDALKALRGLKVGDISNVIIAPEGHAIYKIVKATENLPKDYATKKAQYADQMAGDRAGKAIEDDVKKALSGVVKWSSPAYEVIYDYGQALSDQTLFTDIPKRVKTLQAIVDKAKTAAQSSGPAAKYAAMVEYSAYSNLVRTPGADTVKLSEQKAAVIEDLLQTTEDTNLRLTLVDIYKAKKDGDKASEALVRAAQNNTAYDASGQDVFHKISVKIDELKAAKLLTPEGEQDVQKELERWRRDKKDHDAEVADTKRIEEEERKKADADLKAHASSDRDPAPATKATTPPASGGKK